MAAGVRARRRRPRVRSNLVSRMRDALRHPRRFCIGADVNHDFPRIPCLHHPAESGPTLDTIGILGSVVHKSRDSGQVNLAGEPDFRMISRCGWRFSLMAAWTHRPWTIHEHRPDCRRIGTVGLVIFLAGPVGVSSMHGRRIMKLRPAVEPFEARQLLSAGVHASHAAEVETRRAALALRSDQTPGSPTAASDSTTKDAAVSASPGHHRTPQLARSFLGYRITNPTKFKVNLIPPFGQVLVQMRSPCPVRSTTCSRSP